MMASSAGSAQQGQPEPRTLGYGGLGGFASFLSRPGTANGSSQPLAAGKQPLEVHEPSAATGSEQSGAAEGDGGSQKRASEGQADGDAGRRKRSRSPGSAAERSADGAASDSELEEGGEEDPHAVPERLVGEAEEAEQKAALKTSWELVAVLDFLATFQPYLNLGHLQFSAEELESALVLSDGTAGLLPDLHCGLLKGISTRSTVHAGNWTTSLAEKLKAYWRQGRLPGEPPFACRRRYEAASYATLPVANRVSALRVLCELRLEKEDLHNVVEHALHPPRAPKAAAPKAAPAGKGGRKAAGAPAEAPPPTMEQMRRPPFARDSSGLVYWYLDHHKTTGTRMYRETPESLLKGKARKAGGPQWELVASSAEELEELGRRLRRSKKAADQELATTLLEELVPQLLERREADLRRQRAAAKMATQLDRVLPDGAGGYGGRPRRARKEVNYSFDAYDAQIRAALRTTGRSAEELETRAARAAAAVQEPRLTAEEEAQLGLRRGRSAHAAEPALELPPTTRRPKAAATPQPSRTPTPPPAAGAPLQLPPSLPGSASLQLSACAAADARAAARQPEANGQQQAPAWQPGPAAQQPATAAQQPAAVPLVQAFAGPAPVPVWQPDGRGGPVAWGPPPGQQWPAQPQWQPGQQLPPGAAWAPGGHAFPGGPNGGHWQR